MYNFREGGGGGVTRWGLQKIGIHLIEIEEKTKRLTNDQTKNALIVI